MRRSCASGTASTPGGRAGRLQCRKPPPITQLVAPSAALAAQHGVLLPQHHEFGVLGHLNAGQHHQAAQPTAHMQVDGRDDRTGMIPSRHSVQARSDIERHKIWLVFS